MDPINASDPALWRELKDIFGPGGLALLIAFAASLYFNRMQWIRLKEKDTECLAEREKAREYSRQDAKEAFGQVAELTKQVTILTAAATNTRSRSD